jgi:hypothetical protein
VNDDTYHKTELSLQAWEKVRGDLPEPDVMPRPGETGRCCYVKNIRVAKQVLAALKKHAGDPYVDRDIWMIEASLRSRLSPRGDETHG